MDHEARFLQIFAGSDVAFTRGFPDPTASKGMRYTTVRRAPTEKDVELHLSGTVSIVRSPLLPDNTVLWGATDRDKGRDDLRLIESPILRQTFRTKSGGLRDIVFFPDPRPASMVRVLLRHEAARLGFPECEVFPKQDEAPLCGNGINLPFFNDRDGFAKFEPLFYTVPLTEWPTPEDEPRVAGDDDEGSRQSRNCSRQDHSTRSRAFPRPARSRALSPHQSELPSPGSYRRRA